MAAVAESIPQAEARRLQLAMISGNEPPGVLLELRSRRPQGTVRRNGFYDARDIDRVSNVAVSELFPSPDPFNQEGS